MVGMATVEEGANVLYVVLVADLHRLRWVGHHWRNNWIFSCRMRRSEVKLEDFCPHTPRTSFNFHPVLVFVCNMCIEIWNMESRVGSHPSVTISSFTQSIMGLKALRWQMSSWRCSLKGKLLLHARVRLQAIWEWEARTEGKLRVQVSFSTVFRFILLHCEDITHVKLHIYWVFYIVSSAAQLIFFLPCCAVHILSPWQLFS